MKTKQEILSQALATQDPQRLYTLLEQALALADFHAAQAAFSRTREQRLQEQVQRQTAMIDNLERTLWGKK